MEAFDVVADVRDRENWLRERRKLLGASDIPAVLGLSPWTPAVEVWATKTSRYEEAPDDVSEAMEIGREIEPWLLSAVERRTRCAVQAQGKLLRSKKHPWLGCTLDGKIEARRGTPLRAFQGLVGSVETKVSGAAFAGEWVNPTNENAGLVPDHYLPQVDAQLAVTGMPFAVFGVLMGGRLAFRWCVVERNEKRIAELVDRTGTWWEQHVKLDVPPEPDGSERASEMIAHMYPEQGGIVSLDDVAAEYVVRLKAMKADIRGREKEAKQVEQALKMAIGGASAGELPDGTRVELRTVKRKGYSVEPVEYRTLVLPKSET